MNAMHDAESLHAQCLFLNMHVIKFHNQLSEFLFWCNNAFYHHCLLGLQFIDVCDCLQQPMQQFAKASACNFFTVS